jgi:hypothetical protein
LVNAGTQVIDNFSEKCMNIMQLAISHYDEYAHQYDKTTYDKVRKELA